MSNLWKKYLVRRIYKVRVYQCCPTFLRMWATFWPCNVVKRGMLEASLSVLSACRPSVEV